ncbi:Tribbles homolog 2 [Eumeta japonica]|uniref:Tribbles homolog 2 n=1 Tax=Eumeta variegata TaxID=151549 RepID=A0A4C1WKF8_EUMVA|nr:Tribbles homolog 2 [Eumeta japonica]
MMRPVKYEVAHSAMMKQKLLRHTHRHMSRLRGAGAAHPAIGLRLDCVSKNRVRVAAQAQDSASEAGGKLMLRNKTVAIHGAVCSATRPSTAPTTLKLESLEDAVVLDEPEQDLLQDKRGCPAYVSPEILRAHHTYSGRAADMWSLGVILYTMLVGRHRKRNPPAGRPWDLPSAGRRRSPHLPAVMRQRLLTHTRPPTTNLPGTCPRYPFNDSEHASLFAKISRGYFVVPECLSSRGKCLIRSLLRREACERLSARDVLRHPWLARDPRNELPPRAAAAHDRLVPDIDMRDCV